MSILNQATMERLLEKTASVKDTILIRNFLIEIPQGKSKTFSKREVATIFSNLSYYGYVLSKEAVKCLTTMTETGLQHWWAKIETVLKEITGDSKKMDKYVVYKNFPQEVLNMTEAEYWFNQICMYIGMPNEWFATEPKERDPLFKKDALKVLHLAGEYALDDVLRSLLASTVKWNRHQLHDVKYLVDVLRPTLTATSIPFKENLVTLIEYLMAKDVDIKLKSATDVMRLATVMSGGDLNATTHTKFKRFKKKERRFFLNMLEKTSSLEEDMARDVERWKVFIFLLHPGDWSRRYPKVVDAMNNLYKDEVLSFNARFDKYLRADTGKRTRPSRSAMSGLELMATRPGEFMRRIKVLALAYPNNIGSVFMDVSEKMSILQLLKLKKYLEITNTRLFRMFPPKGNWSKVKIVNNDGVKIKDEVILILLSIIAERIMVKMVDKLGSTVKLDERTKMIKLSGSDSTEYGRGTTFPIPEHVTFVRSASYWGHKGGGYNNWFDNGWNFFDDNWNDVGAVAWNEPQFTKKAALFSGDPTNSKTADGRACQMIDLYLDKLEAQGVRYGVWNILCYSKIKFKDAEEVFAALQWGDDATKGKLFEPSRAQVAFALKDNVFSKYIVYIDIKERKLVYIDTNFKANVMSAIYNGKTLSEKMPAFVEYLEGIPSVYDMFESLNNRSKSSIPVLYDDANVEVTDGSKAYIFRPLNEKNKFEKLDLNGLL
jgi:hypothetical protein